MTDINDPAFIGAYNKTPRIARESLKKGWNYLKTNGLFANYASYENWEKAVYAKPPEVVEQPLQEDLENKMAELQQKKMFWEATGGEGEPKL